jgi:hypothetical protein
MVTTAIKGKPVKLEPADAIFCKTLLDDLIRIAAYVSKADSYTGELRVDNGRVVRNPTNLPASIQQRGIDVKEGAPRERVLQAIVILREQARALLTLEGVR